VGGYHHAPAALLPRKKVITHFPGGWVGLGPVWTDVENRPHRDRSRTVQPVAIRPTDDQYKLQVPPYLKS